MESLPMDPIWEIFGEVTENYSRFKTKFVPELYLRPEVPEDVRSSIEIARRLTEFSYFEYKFYDEALLKVMTSFEMALKIRYYELTKEEWDWKRKGLKQLIGWFNERNAFEVENPDFLDVVKDVRNQLAHPDRHNFSGPHCRTLMENVVDLINDIYEDAELRMKRMEPTRRISEWLNRYRQGVFCQLNNTGYLACSAWLAFIDNKTVPPEIHFYFSSICDVGESERQANTWINPPIYYFKASTVVIGNEKILLSDNQGNMLSVSADIAEDQQKELTEWIALYRKRCYPLEGYIAVKGDMVDSYSYHVRQFYQK